MTTYTHPAHQTAYDTLCGAIADSCGHSCIARVEADLIDTRAILRDLPDYHDYTDTTDSENNPLIEIWGGDEAEGTGWRITASQS